MKKLFSLFLMFVMIATLCVPVSGKTFGITTQYTTESGYSFSILEYETDNHQIVRQYKKANSAATLSVASSDDLLADAEEIMLALGYDQDTIDNMRPESLLKYAEGLEITTTTGYIKTDAEGVSSYVSKEAVTEALNNVSPRASGVVTDEDEYIEVKHTAIHEGDALYFFSTTAIWLKMPTFRKTDSIGSCAQDIAVVPNSGTGWVQYTVNYNYLSSGTTTSESKFLWVTSYANASYDSWNGSVCTFTLPANYTASDYSQTYTNFRAYYEFEAYLQYPELITNFNSIGTYSHQKLFIGEDPSVSISLDGTDEFPVSASIGLSASWGVKQYSVELLLRYTPD